MTERAIRGDKEAYADLLRLHEATAYRVAVLITGSAADAEDAMQEAFIRGYRALHRFRRGAPFRPWLLKIVANTARNRRRAESRLAHLAARSSGAELEHADSAEDDALDAAERSRLYAAVDRLPERDRVAIVSRYFLDLSTEETALVLRCRPGAARMRLTRALDRLRLLLEAPDG